MDPITATLPATHVENARNLGDKYETIATATTVAVDPASGELHQSVVVRWYMARRSDGASPVHCSIWVHSETFFCSGYGRASGYGYHKASAALQQALTSAGIRLCTRIDGVGDSATREALSAITRALGYDTFTIVGV